MKVKHIYLHKRHVRGGTDSGPNRRLQSHKWVYSGRTEGQGKRSERAVRCLNEEGARIRAIMGSEKSKLLPSSFGKNFKGFLKAVWAEAEVSQPLQFLKLRRAHKKPKNKSNKQK